MARSLDFLYCRLCVSIGNDEKPKLEFVILPVPLALDRTVEIDQTRIVTARPDETAFPAIILLFMIENKKIYVKKCLNQAKPVYLYFERKL